MQTKMPITFGLHFCCSLTSWKLDKCWYFFGYRAWVKKTDSELEAAAKAAQAEEDKDIPILPYSSLFILSSENK